jgi:hypothetical protein
VGPGATLVGAVRVSALILTAGGFVQSDMIGWGRKIRGGWRRMCVKCGL